MGSFWHMRKIRKSDFQKRRKNCSHDRDELQSIHGQKLDKRWADPTTFGCQDNDARGIGLQVERPAGSTEATRCFFVNHDRTLMIS